MFIGMKSRTRVLFLRLRTILYNYKQYHNHSRPQRLRSFWSAPRTSGRVRFSEHVQRIRFALSVNQSCQTWLWACASDGKSVNRGLPVLDLPRGRDSWCWPKGAWLLGTRKYHNKHYPWSCMITDPSFIHRLKTLNHSTFFFIFFPLQLIKFLRDASVVIQLWGKQVVDKKPVNVAAKKGKNTKAIMRAETLKKNVSCLASTRTKIKIFLKHYRRGWRFKNYEGLCMITRGVAKGGPGGPWPPPPLWKLFFKQTTYSRWRKGHDNLVSTLTLTQCAPPPLWKILATPMITHVCTDKHRTGRFVQQFY